MKNVFSIIAPAIIATSAGCASSLPPPNENLADAMAAQRSAEEVGAESNPAAQLHLRLASEQIVKARTLLQGGDKERADYLLMRARADAELALALTREQTAAAEAQRTQNQLDTMRAANARQGAQQ